MAPKYIIIIRLATTTISSLIKIMDCMRIINTVHKSTLTIETENRAMIIKNILNRLRLNKNQFTWFIIYFLVWGTLIFRFLLINTIVRVAIKKKFTREKIP